jgi:DHA1 family tetracycline resistance protein-like MFS transporter
MNQTTPAVKSKILFFLYATAFLTTMGMGLVGPVLPYLVGRFVGDPNALAGTVSALMASYALCAFIAAPAFGILADRYGRRPVLLVSLAGSAIGYIVFGLAGALPMLFLGRIVDGLTAGNFSALFGMLADTTQPEERGPIFARLGAVLGGGTILGPAVGGLASHISLEAPVYIAAALCLLTVAWGYFLAPETHTLERTPAPVRLAQLNPFTQIAELLAVTQLRPLLLAGALFMLPFAMMQGLFGVQLKTALGWGPDLTSTVFVAVGVSDILVQGLFLGWLQRRFGELPVARGALLLGIAGLIGQGLLSIVPSSLLAYSGVLMFAIGEGMFSTTLRTLLSQAAGDAQGKVQGGNQALNAGAQVVGPLAGGSLASSAGVSLPFYVGAGLVALAGLALGNARAAKTQPSSLEAHGS